MATSWWIVLLVKPAIFLIVALLYYIIVHLPARLLARGYHLAREAASARKSVRHQRPIRRRQPRQ